MVVKVRGPGNAGVTHNSVKNIFKAQKIHLNIDDYIKNRNPNYNYTVWNNNKMSGFAFLKPSKNTLELELIMTRPGQGYGTALIKKIKQNAKVPITLISLPAARKFL
jgi:hypothetical protein